MKPEFFVLDVDGVMTTGQFVYSSAGKITKTFGAHDADGLKLVRDLLTVRFITADKRGLPITQKRIEADMGYPLDVVTEADRLQFLTDLGLDRVIFMGDGFFDAKVMKHCAFSIAPANARREARAAAHFVTESRAAEGAVLDACLEILRRFFPEVEA